MKKNSQRTETNAQTNDWFDEQDLRYYMSLSAEEKLNQLEDMQDFFNSIVNPERDELWKRLREEGF